MNRRSMIAMMSAAGVAVAAEPAAAKPVLEVGDVVTCSGHGNGPQLMTVTAVKGDLVRCDWFDNDTHCHGIYSIPDHTFRKWKPA